MSGVAAKGRRSVLVVDDDPDIRDVLGAFLEMKGCSVLLAADGQEALDRLGRSERLPCFILLDLKMPGMDGVEFRAAQERDPRLAGIPVVVVSADLDISRTVARLRAAAFLAKPIDTEALIGLVQRYCPAG